jgi:predicted acetyltransferase
MEPPEDVVRYVGRDVSAELVTPALEYLPGYVSALDRGWAADRERPAQWIENERAEIAKGDAQYVAAQADPRGNGLPVTLPDGSQVPRLPGIRRWIWDGEFCGLINFRWQPGTHALPEYVLGHIGYSIVAWKQRRGYATAALAMLLREVRTTGLDYVLLTTDPDNLASQKVIVANGGVLVGRFTKSAHHGGKPGLRYRIDL